ncbi:hypothetical protein [Shewanella algae]|uniref:hypothetical protein n=1 Tax=Shewanella algae TaxID=38313 RepID=UPI0031F4C314
MSIEHKAFIFNSDAFFEELQPILVNCMESDKISLIRDFIDENKEEIKDPYEGESVDDYWEDMIEEKDIQQYGDFALTKYYYPSDDIGLGSNWDKLSEYLVNSLGLNMSPVLGYPLLNGDVIFDPGKMGSYFQTKEDVINNLNLIADLNPPMELKDLFEEFKLILINASEQEKGLYVTF